MRKPPQDWRDGLERYPDWAKKLGPPPRSCLFCGRTVRGQFMAGVFSPDADLSVQVKESVGYMFSVCEDCMDKNDQAIEERIRSEISRRTRVN